MSFAQRQVAHCDICGHEWLTDKVPSHCAKCKSRKWNAGLTVGIVASTLTDQVQVQEWPGAAMHDPKTCRTYKCGMCAAIKAASP